MKTFDPARSAALRRQLGMLPTTTLESTTLPRDECTPAPAALEQEQEQEQTRSRNPLSAALLHRDAAARILRRRSRWIIGGVGVTVTAGLLASGPFQPTSTSGADFVPAMARPQQPEDLLPHDVRENPGTLDASTSRLVGTERGYFYYAAESIDGMMCLVLVEPTNPVNPDGSTAASGFGCTPLENFDSYPLLMTSSTTNSKVWLVSANIEPTDRQITEQTQLSPNLYIEYTDDVPLQPGDEGYEHEPS